MGGGGGILQYFVGFDFELTSLEGLGGGGDGNLNSCGIVIVLIFPGLDGGGGGSFFV